MRVLLAIDGSRHSEAAVNEVARRRCSADHVRVISVVEPTSPASFAGVAGANASLYVAAEKAAHDRARTAVEQAVATLSSGEADNRCDITTGVLSGSPKRVILKDAETFGADLIVVGSHGHGLLDRFLLGSVSHAVAIHAGCSVEIVRSQRRDEGK